MTSAEAVPRKNLAVGFLSRIYIGAINLLTVPILLSWLGPEAFGLIGLSATMQMLCYIMDAGFSSTVTRELARNGTSGILSNESIVSCRGIEKFYWIASPAISLSALLIGSLFVLQWSNSGQISQTDLFASIALMSVAIGFQWVIGFYVAAFYGLNYHGSVATLQSVFWTVRTIGAIGVLWAIDQTPLTYFIWQASVSLVGAVVFRFRLHGKLPVWRSLPDPYTVLGSLRTYKHLVLSASGVSAVLLMFNQVDKVIVGMRFDLETFGYYTLAWQIAGALYLIYSPLYNAYLPAIAAAVSAGDRDAIWRQARDGALLMAALVIPLAVIILVFSHEIIFVWTGNVLTADRTYLFLSVVFAGAACHALFFIPYAVQMSFGRTNITLAVALVLLVPMVLVMFVVGLYGGNAIAVASVWAAFSLMFLIGTTLETTRSLLRVSVSSWVWVTLMVPAGVSAVVSGAVQGLVELEGSRVVVGLWVLCIYLVSFSAMLAVSPKVRGAVFGALREWMSVRATEVL